MTLLTLLSLQRADTEDVTSPKLHVTNGVLTEEEEKFVSGPEYRGLPYCYVLPLDSNSVQLYDNGTARYGTPVDVIFESTDLEHPERVQNLWDWFFDAVLAVDEVRPGVLLAEPFARVGGHTVTTRRKGFIEAALRLESSTVYKRAPPIIQIP